MHNAGPPPPSGQPYSRWGGSLNRSELQVQFLEAPEQKGTVPFQPTIARWTVLGLRKPNVGHPVEDASQARPRFRTRNRGAGTSVNTTAECYVLQYIWAFEAEFIRLVEPLWIAVCRTVQHQYAGAGSHIDVADPGGAPGQPKIRFDRALVLPPRNPRRRRARQSRALPGCASSETGAISAKRKVTWCALVNRRAHQSVR